MRKATRTPAGGRFDAGRLLNRLHGLGRESIENGSFGITKDHALSSPFGSRVRGLVRKSGGIGEKTVPPSLGIKTRLRKSGGPIKLGGRLLSDLR
ncbi:MAG TPA: hypothetical protein DDX19_06950 [Rhodopirellula baltica]|uniref:Uncharacterized protein n=1 Tax=Rhodopirellula baltica (strain DSM 10527 / NCIMB 13988 / SH1) TaxID=243090 RepID=Q7UQL5_RHOBA|nr:hypothetical protein RB6244 [Rhodopirellula baltica SH 1]HBE62471.1 hypothetical protein [Rhodopirellula baltica]